MKQNSKYGNKYFSKYILNYVTTFKKSRIFTYQFKQKTMKPTFEQLKKRALLITIENSLIRWNNNQSDIRKKLMLDFLSK